MKQTMLEFWELREYGITFTRQHIHRLEGKDKFPKRVKMGDRRIGWVESEITDYVAEKISSRSTSAGKSKGVTKKRGETSPRPSDDRERLRPPRRP